jgi:hypothetical protein
MANAKRKIVHMWLDDIGTVFIASFMKIFGGLKSYCARTYGYENIR